MLALAVSFTLSPIAVRGQTPHDWTPRGGVRPIAGHADYHSGRAVQPIATTDRGRLKWRAPGGVSPASHRTMITGRRVSYPSLEPPRQGATQRPAAGESYRVAQAITVADAFQDPFGDRQPADGGGAAQPPAAGGGFQPPAQPDPRAPVPGGGFQPPTQPDPDDSLPGGGIPRPGNDPAPGLPDGFSPAPATPGPDELPPKRDGVCKEIHNKRDCCTAISRCQDARDLVRADTIASISLDITPLFQPNAAEYEQQILKEKVTEKLKSRTWENRAGQVLFDGRLLDYRQGRIVVIDDDGRTHQARFGQLSNEDRCYVTAWWTLPTECSLGSDRYVTRTWEGSTLTWKASALCHKPLYFEEVQLERYGHSAGPILQPAISSAHFFLNVATLPYKMGIHPPRECRYALGYYRPGNCAPWLLRPIPISLRGAVAQGGSLAYLIAILP